MKTLSERQERILLSLKKLDFLNRDQLRKIHRLGAIRNTNRVLKELSPYLSNYRQEYSTIYYLNKEGREYINCKKVRKPNNYVHHSIMRNDFYIKEGFPNDWSNEIKISDGKNTIICDAWFKRSGKFHFLEVDSTQKMKENRSKIDIYSNFYKTGRLSKHLGYFPVLIWLTTTEYRRQQLKELCKDFACEVYTTNDIR